MELPRAEMDIEFVAGEDVGYDLVERETAVAAARPDAGLTPTPVPRTFRLTTAAALANGGQPSAPVDADVFRQGMRVLHDTYGLGQIVAISGTAARRKATVDFPPPVGRKRLLLADGSLRPMEA
jgi:DNA helicase-2/ATP-dependent DNA helicase PcrA